MEKHKRIPPDSTPPKPTTSISNMLVDRRTILAGAITAIAGAVAFSISPSSEPPLIPPPTPETIAGIQTETVVIKTHTFTIIGTPQEIAQLKKALSGALLDLQEFAFPYTPNSTDPLTIRMVGKDQLSANIIAAEVNYEPDQLTIYGLGVEGDQKYYRIEPRKIKEILVLNSHFALRSTIAHELIHIMLSSMGNLLWQEGIAYAAEIFSYSREDIPDAVKEASHMVQFARFGLQQFPVNMDSFLQCASTKNLPWNSRYMTKRIAGSAWYAYIKAHPQFLSAFANELRVRLGNPQVYMPTESALIELAGHIDGNFRDWYLNQPCFRKPAHGDVIFKYYQQSERDMKGKTVVIVFSGKWEEVTIKDIFGKHLNVLDFVADLPVTIRGKYVDADGQVRMYTETFTEKNISRQNFHIIIELDKNSFDNEIFDPRTRSWKQIPIKRDLPW